MGRNKRKKLAEVDNLPNVFSYRSGNIEERLLEYLPGANQFILELGCGRGDYSIALAEKYPERNFIGMDIRGARIWNGSKTATDLLLGNVAFVISRAEFLPEIFNKIKFSEIWIPFPDPFPKKRSENRRLLSPMFLERFRRITLSNAVVNLKTDDDGLYNYALEKIKEANLNIIKTTDNLYNESALSFEESIKTKYESMHLQAGKTIKFLRFKLN